MADKAIGDLTQATYLDDESLLVVEQQGEALKLTGKMFANFAREAAAADIQKAVDAAASAETAKTGAETAADRAEAARDSIVLDEQKIAQAVADAQASADSAGRSAEDAAASADEAEDWANKSQSYAEQASVPAVAGVYNVILTDRVTGEKYALLVESGRISLLGVSDTLDAVDMTLIDNTTGTAYALVVDDGRLAIEEV